MLLHSFEGPFYGAIFEQFFLQTQYCKRRKSFIVCHCMDVDFHESQKLLFPLFCLLPKVSELFCWHFFSCFFIMTRHFFSIGNNFRHLKHTTTIPVSKNLVVSIGGFLFLFVPFCKVEYIMMY